MIEKLKNIIEKNKLIKFLLVGGSSTCIDFIIYMLLSKIIFVSISKLVSMTISCAYSFLLNRNWTFENKSTKTNIQIIKFIISQCINIATNVCINQGMLWITNNKIISYIIATLCAMTVNYILQKNIVFREEKK